MRGLGKLLRRAFDEMRKRARREEVTGKKEMGSNSDDSNEEEEEEDGGRCEIICEWWDGSKGLH